MIPHLIKTLIYNIGSIEIEDITKKGLESTKSGHDVNDELDVNSHCQVVCFFEVVPSIEKGK